MSSLMSLSQNIHWWKGKERDCLAVQCCTYVLVNTEGQETKHASDLQHKRQEVCLKTIQSRPLLAALRIQATIDRMMFILTSYTNRVGLLRPACCCASGTFCPCCLSVILSTQVQVFCQLHQTASRQGEMVVKRVPHDLCLLKVLPQLLSLPLPDKHTS